MQILSGDGTFGDAVTLSIALSAIPLAVSLGVGLCISIFQAATQIQEQTLSFVPKLAAVSAALFFLGPWMLKQAVEYTTNLLLNLNQMALM